MLLLVWGYVPRFLRCLSGSQAGETLQGKEQWVRVKNEISRLKHLSYTEPGHKTTVFLLLVEDLIWLDKIDFVPFFSIASWYGAEHVLQAEGMGERSCRRSALQKASSLPNCETAWGGKKILHHLICKLRKGSTQYLCSRGNETNLEKHKRPLESHSLILCSCRHQAQNDIQNTHKSSAFAWKGDRNYYNVAFKKKKKKKFNDSFSVAKRNVIYE